MDLINFFIFLPEIFEETVAAVMSGEADKTLLFFLVFLAALLFLLIREFITWYFKQTKIVSLLKKIEKNTRKNTREINEYYQKHLSELEGQVPVKKQTAIEVLASRIKNLKTDKSEVSSESLTKDSQTPLQDVEIILNQDDQQDDK